MAINDVFRLSVEGLGPNAQQVVCVFHYRQTGALGDDSGEDLCDAWENTLVGAWADIISADCLITKLEARNVTQPLFGFDHAIEPNVPGTLVGQTLPPMNSAVISWRTGLIGRSRRGRNYVWPAGEAEQNLGQWTPTYLTAVGVFATAALAITDVVSGAEYALVVWSPTLSASTTVTSYQVDALVGTQRRRRPGRGS